MDTDYVLCEVGTHVLCKIQVNFSLGVDNEKTEM